MQPFNIPNLATLLINAVTGITGRSYEDLTLNDLTETLNNIFSESINSTDSSELESRHKRSDSDLNMFYLNSTSLQILPRIERQDSSYVPINSVLSAASMIGWF